MADGFEPHGTIWPAVPHPSLAVVLTWVGEGVPGVWDWGRAGRGYTGTPARTLPGPIFSLFKAKGPTYGQMKAILDYFMRFLRYGHMGPRIDLRIDPESTLRDPPQTGPEMTLRYPQMTLRTLPVKRPCEKGSF